MFETASKTVTRDIQGMSGLYFSWDHYVNIIVSDFRQEFAETFEKRYIIFLQFFSFSAMRLHALLTVTNETDTYVAM